MEAIVMNTNFESVGLIDTFNSFIWTDRYSSYGDFEIYTLPSQDLLEICQDDYYVWNIKTDHVMIIEERKIVADPDSGTFLSVIGRSLESILTRRIIWKQTTLQGNLQAGIERLLNENVINPSIADRKINNFIFKSSSDPIITELTIDAQYTGENLYDTIETICIERNIGFKITLNETNQFVFELYSGQNRSYSQSDNSYVIFSPEFDNILNSNYLEATTNLKNVALVAGEGEDNDRKTSVVGSGSDLTRRELYVDARDISSRVDGGETDETIPLADYIKLLDQRGHERLSEYKDVHSFEGEVEASRTFIFGIDFFMGDIVQIVNEFGIESESRVNEIVMSHDANGETIIPTFSIVDKEEEVS